jgi:hypothetical protein
MQASVPAPNAGTEACITDCTNNLNQREHT